MTKNSWQPTASNEMLLARARMLKNIRAFFEARDVVEVETPLLSHYSSSDPHLDSLRSQFRDQFCYLNTSPEYAMKRLLASWGRPIFQICKAFRDDELGPNHNPEFTMLEWYQPGYDMPELMMQLAELIESLCYQFKHFSADSPVAAKPEFEYLSYQQAFEDFSGFNPHQATAQQCAQLAIKHDVEIPQGLGVDDDVNDWLDWLLTQMILPAFKKDGFTFLYDYPASQCALAKIANNEGVNGPMPHGQKLKVAKRFELFYGEVELANGFYELTDAAEQQQRFLMENEKRLQMGKESARIDENFISALNAGMPDCSGVAVGLDRLLMVLGDASCINQVLSFSWQNA